MQNICEREKIKNITECKNLKFSALFIKDLPGKWYKTP